MTRALERYADRDDFVDDIAMRAQCHYFYDLTTGEKNESK
jgi:hypothetical protein